MNEVIKKILERRSVRKYTDQSIARKDLDLILKCAQVAPSGMNAQSSQFTVLFKKELEELRPEVRKDIALSDNAFWKNLSASTSFCFYYNAPVLILVSSDPENKPSTPLSDAAAAIENMMLAAQSLGISSCWIHALAMIKRADNARAILAKWGLPKNHEICGGVALGYADGPIPERHLLKGNKIVFADSQHAI